MTVALQVLLPWLLDEAWKLLARIIPESWFDSATVAIHEAADGVDVRLPGDPLDKETVKVAIKNALHSVAAKLTGRPVVLMVVNLVIDTVVDAAVDALWDRIAASGLKAAVEAAKPPVMAAVRPVADHVGLAV